MKIALIVGHKSTSQGATNKIYGISEYNINNLLIDNIINRYTGTHTLVKVLRTTYSILPLDINNQDPNFAISLHANAYNTKVSGTEMLYYHNSVKGKLIAEVLQKNICNVLGLNNRGIKPKTAEDRGGYVLKYTKCPIVIAEPFFIDNDYDCDIFFKRRDTLIQCFIDSIDQIGLIMGGA